MVMGLMNCWNFKKCGRHPGGEKSHELGVCPATTMQAADGYLNGRNAGRACMYVNGTFCGGTVQGDARAKQENCIKCDYYKALKNHFGVDVSAMKFNQHANNNPRPGAYTPPSQPWGPRR